MSDLHPLVTRFVQEAGHMTQSLGLGRVVGQIYAYLYFSPEPRGLADMQHSLAISKGSASMGVRQLEQWGAVRQVWVRGDRKDYYQASDWFGRIIKSAVADTIGKKLGTYSTMLDEVEAELNTKAAKDAKVAEGDGESEFLKARIEHLRKFQKRAEGVWNSPVLKMLMK